MTDTTLFPNMWTRDVDDDAALEVRPVVAGEVTVKETRIVDRDGQSWLVVACQYGVRYPIDHYGQDAHIDAIRDVEISLPVKSEDGALQHLAAIKEMVVAGVEGMADKIASTENAKFAADIDKMVAELHRSLGSAS